MSAFKDAASVSYDENITNDAYFNYAKLAFDLNDDSSIFSTYMQKYPNVEKDDRINSYMAVAALHKKDYEGAIQAYDRIEVLNQDMRDNYMKANYQRARQMVTNGAYRDAVPYLEVAAYYAIPVLDLWSLSGIQPRVDVLMEKYCPDGLHPNDAGHERMAAVIGAYLENL